MSGFSNPVAAGGGALIRDRVHSPNYAPGTTGWTINQDGTAEFNTLGGTIQFNTLGVFFYIPNAGIGNLRLSITMADGVDQYGNLYKAGLFVNQEQIWATGDNSNTVMINPNGQLGPEILFFPAGFAAIAHIIGVHATNRLLIEGAAGSGATVEVNAPFLASGGYQGMNTGMGAQPPFNVTGSFVDFTTLAWFPLTILCPASETIAINTTLYGYNNNSAASTLSVGPHLKVGATTLMNALIGQNACVVTPEGDAAGATNSHFKSVQYIVGPDILGGRAGQTLTVVPAWRISSGSAVTASITNASMSAYPLPFVQPQSG